MVTPDPNAGTPGLAIGTNAAPRKAAELVPLEVFENRTAEQRVRIATNIMGTIEGLLVDEKRHKDLTKVIKDADEHFGKNEPDAAIKLLRDNGLFIANEQEFYGIFHDNSGNDMEPTAGLIRLYAAANGHYKDAKGSNDQGEKYAERKIIAGILQDIYNDDALNKKTLPKNHAELKLRIEDAQQKRIDEREQKVRAEAKQKRVYVGPDYENLFVWMDRHNKIAMGEKNQYTQAIIEKGSYTNAQGGSAFVETRETTSGKVFRVSNIDVSQEQISAFASQTRNKEIDLGEGLMAENPFADLEFKLGKDKYRIVIEERSSGNSDEKRLVFKKLKIDEDGKPVKNKEGNDDETILNGLDKVQATFTNNAYKGLTVDEALKSALMKMEGAVKNAKQAEAPKRQPGALEVGEVRKPADALKRQMQQQTADAKNQEAAPGTIVRASNASKLKK